MTDRVAEVLPMQDIMDDATVSKLSGKGVCSLEETTTSLQPSRDMKR